MIGRRPFTLGLLLALAIPVRSWGGEPPSWLPKYDLDIRLEIVASDRKRSFENRLIVLPPNQFLDSLRKGIVASGRPQEPSQQQAQKNPEHDAPFPDARRSQLDNGFLYLY